MDVHRIESEVAAATKEVQILRELAVTHYMRALAAGSAYDVDVFRVVALWFGAATDAPSPVAEPDGRSQVTVSAIVQTEMQWVASSKFLPLTYQILSRSVARSGCRRRRRPAPDARGARARTGWTGRVQAWRGERGG